MKQLLNKAMHLILAERMKRIQRFMSHPHEVQNQLLSKFINVNTHTYWGKQHGFKDIKNANQFTQNVPIQDYESLKPLISRMMLGESDILWNGNVKWFSKSSGTTNDKSKFIPVSRENLYSCHIRGGWDTASLIYHHDPNARIFEGKFVIMGGSTQHFEAYPKTQFGDVSAIMIQHLPWVGRQIYAPDVATTLLSNTEEKIQLMAQKLLTEDVRMLTGVPTWTIVLFKYMLEMSGKNNILEIWPNLHTYAHGGVSIVPYTNQFHQFFPSDQVHYWQVYNASEGFIATQPDPYSQDMLLMLDNGIYYELLTPDQWNKPNPQAIPLSDAKIGEKYALVITTNAGLWRYVPGDVIEFTSTLPYRIRITGRTQQFVNTFGEEVMVANTDKALADTCKQTNALALEYTVAPIYMQNEHKGGHEWIIEFEKEPKDVEAFNNLLDNQLQKINSDYEAKRFKSMAMERLRLRIVPKGTFHNWMKMKGKFGGQAKVPRLANHREYVEEILRFASENV